MKTVRIKLENGEEFQAAIDGDVSLTIDGVPVAEIEAIDSAQMEGGPEEGDHSLMAPMGDDRTSSPSIETDPGLEVTAEGGRRCIMCNGRRWCVSRGCVHTPCGWLCAF